MGEHRYELGVRWTGNRGAGTTGYRDYDRHLTLTAAGKPVLLGSADPTFRGDAERWNPEELLVAALAQCHLLSYLHVAVTHGVVVTDYSDDPVGLMTQQGIGGHFTQVVLHPVVTDRRPGPPRPRHPAARRGRVGVLHRVVGQLPGDPRAADPGGATGLRVGSVVSTGSTADSGSADDSGQGRAATEQVLSRSPLARATYLLDGGRTPRSTQAVSRSKASRAQGRSGRRRSG